MKLITRDEKFEQTKAVLESIALANGHLTPASVVEAAKDPESPLHDRFVWDDTEAGRLYRLAQAGHLIRSIKIEVYRMESATQTVRVTPMRAYQSPPSIRGDRSYVQTQKALTDTDMRAELLATAKKELASMRIRYRDLSELAGVWAAVDAI